MTIKAAAAEQDDDKNDEKDVHVWLQCVEATSARQKSSIGAGTALPDRKLNTKSIMERIEVGQMLRTSYGTGPYKVLSITRNCTCHDPLDFFEEGAPLPAHVHMTVRTMTEDHNKGEVAYLGYYDEGTLLSVARVCKDRLILCENNQLIQTTLAL